MNTRAAHIVVLDRDGHRFVLVFDSTVGAQADALRTLGRWAADPELIFDWHDAAEMSGSVRRISG